MTNKDDIYELEDSLTVRDSDGTAALKFVLAATFYLRPKVNRKLVRNTIGEFCKLMSGHLMFHKSPVSFEWSQIDPSQIDERLDETFSEDSGAELEIGFKGGESPGDASDFSVTALILADWESDPSYIKFCVPITYFTDREDSFVDFVRETVRSIAPFHGYGGLMFEEASNKSLAQQMEPAVYAMAQRFVGVEVDRPYSHLSYVTNGIKSVNWITFFDKCLLEAGAEIENDLLALEPDGITFEMINNTIMVKSGAKPQISDRNTKELPVAYMKTARVLEKIMISQHRSFHSGLPSRFDRESSEAWLRRFLDLPL